MYFFIWVHFYKFLSDKWINFPYWVTHTFFELEIISTHQILHKSKIGLGYIGCSFVETAVHEKMALDWKHFAECKQSGK